MCYQDPSPVTCVTSPVSFLCSNFDLYALSIGTKAIMKSDINYLTEFFLSHSLPLWGCLVVETHGKLIEIAMVRGNVHSSLHVGISVELQQKSFIDNIRLFPQSFMVKESREFEIITFFSS